MTKAQTIVMSILFGIIALIVMTGTGAITYAIMQNGKKPVSRKSRKKPTIEVTPEKVKLPTVAETQPPKLKLVELAKPVVFPPVPTPPKSPAPPPNKVDPVKEHAKKHADEKKRKHEKLYASLANLVIDYYVTAKTWSQYKLDGAKNPLTSPSQAQRDRGRYLEDRIGWNGRVINAIKGTALTHYGHNEMNGMMNLEFRVKTGRKALNEALELMRKDFEIEVRLDYLIK